MMMAIGAELVFARAKSVSQPREYTVNHVKLKEFLGLANWANHHADSTATPTYRVPSCVFCQIKLVIRQDKHFGN